MKRLAPLLALLFAVACAGSPVATSPTPSASAPASAAPTASAPPAALDHRVVYFARDRLPPIGRHVAAAGTGQTESDRIYSRLAELAKAVPSMSGDANLLLNMKAKLQGVSVDKDLATVDFQVPDDDWGVNGSAAVHGLVQQIVFTATEEPGIRRALITQNGKRAVIGGEGLVVDGPRTRDAVSGYAGSSPGIIDGRGDVTAPFGYRHRWSIDEVAPALARLVLETDLAAAGGRNAMPSLRAHIRQNDEQADPQLGKMALTLDVPHAKPSFAGMTMENGRGVVVVDRTPLRAIRVLAEGNGVRYELGLDDERPWRVGLLWDPIRIVVDIGGDPEQLTPGTAVYAPRFGAEVQTIFSLTGMARAFEANVLWRVKDSAGAVTARGTMNATIGTSPVWGAYDTKVILPVAARGAYELEVYQTSAQDGRDIELVRVPLTIR